MTHFERMAEGSSPDEKLFLGSLRASRAIKNILGTSDTWSKTHLCQLTSETAYYIVLRLMDFTFQFLNDQIHNYVKK